MTDGGPTQEILHGNSLELMQAMEESSIDCVVTDPPYVGFGFAQRPILYWRGFKPYVDQMMRVTKSDHRISISQLPNRLALFREKLPPSREIVVSDGFADGRGNDATFLVINPVTTDDQTAETWPADIVPESIHPNERDINKMAILVKAMSNVGDTVLDPFCGSGAIGVAAVLLGRSYVGFELKEDRADDARMRLEAAVKKYQDLSH